MNDGNQISPDLNDTVMFLLNNHVLTGTVVRVYNSRETYHVEVDGERHTVYAADLVGYDQTDEIERLQKQVEKLKSCLVAAGIAPALVDAILNEEG